MELDMKKSYCGVHFVTFGKDVIGCFYTDARGGFINLQGIFANPALHEVYHMYIKNPMEARKT